MTSMPASRRARAMILAPRSWPSRPGLAINTLIFFSIVPFVRRGSLFLCGLYKSPLPGSWPSNPGFAIKTLIFFSIVGIAEEEFTLFQQEKKKQILRCAQDDTFGKWPQDDNVVRVGRGGGLY